MDNEEIAMLRYLTCLVFAALLPALVVPASEAGDKQAPPIRIGMIGLDTSHCPAFTKILHNPKAEGDLKGFRVVAAYPGGSPDVASSRERVAGFTKTMREVYGVEIVDSIEALLKKVDVVMIESVDGRPHWEQARQVLLAGKPVFIDKPVAGSLVDCLRIYQLAGECKVPCFSSSSLRFGPTIAALKSQRKVGRIVGADVFGPCSLEEHHPDLFWYGVHGMEMLYTLMGTGCQKVVRVQTKGTEQVTGTWQDGRIGTFRGIREGKADYGAMVFSNKGIFKSGSYGGYEPLLVEICKFFRTGQPPVAAHETIEMFTFMEAADESKRQGGLPVTLDSVLAKARAKLTVSK
jgi:predicted dehydrogenase